MRNHRVVPRGQTCAEILRLIGADAGTENRVWIHDDCLLRRGVQTPPAPDFVEVQRLLWAAVAGPRAARISSERARELGSGRTGGVDADDTPVTKAGVDGGLVKK